MYKDLQRHKKSTYGHKCTIIVGPQGPVIRAHIGKNVQRSSATSGTSEAFGIFADPYGTMAQTTDVAGPRPEPFLNFRGRFAPALEAQEEHIWP